jgi:hypothetical protein
MTQGDREDGKGWDRSRTSINHSILSQFQKEHRKERMIKVKERGMEREVEGPISRFSSGECRITIKTWPNFSRLTSFSATALILSDCSSH